MPNTKISNLTSAGTLTGSEVAPIVQSGTTVKATAQNIANLAIPSQTGNSGKYLTTNGSTTSWATVGGVPYTSYVAELAWAGVSVAETVYYNNTGYSSAVIGWVGWSAFEIAGQFIGANFSKLICFVTTVNALGGTPYSYFARKSAGSEMVILGNNNLSTGFIRCAVEIRIYP